MYLVINGSNCLNATDMDKKVENFSIFFATEFSEISDPEYEQFLADVWIGIVLTLMVLSCVCCMCSCLLYHKFQQWKRHVIETRQRAEVEGGDYPEADTLPSYTIASGLPTYEEALEQLRKIKESARNNGSVKVSQQHRSSIHRLSVTELVQFYLANTNNSGKS